MDSRVRWSALESSSRQGRPDGLDAKTFDFYRVAFETLEGSGVPFLVGGAYALERYTELARHTKDIDVFVRPEDCDRTLEVLAATGCQTDLTFSHWLGKAFRGDDFIDVIFSSGNGVARVDDEWFEHAVEDVVLGMPAKLCPPEETIWSKAFIMERERFDGADIAHLLRAQGTRLDWHRLLRRFGEHWRVLLSHLVLFGFIYPTEQDNVPAWVMKDLIGRAQDDMDAPVSGSRVCRGTMLSRSQYLVDIGPWGYDDPRLVPDGTMTRRQIARWTAAIDEEK